MIKRTDFEKEPCACPECYQAGVSDQPQLRDPHTGAFLHGYALKRVLEAKAQFWSGFHELVKQRSMV